MIIILFEFCKFLSRSKHILLFTTFCRFIWDLNYINGQTLHDMRKKERTAFYNNLILFYNVIICRETFFCFCYSTFSKCTGSHGHLCALWGNYGIRICYCKLQNYWGLGLGARRRRRSVTWQSNLLRATLETDTQGRSH